MRTIKVNDIICKDFAPIWYTNCKARYRFACGGRNSGKSFNLLGIEPVIRILSNDIDNIIFVRQNESDCTNSCYNNLIQVISMLGLTHLFKFKVSPLQIIKKSTGQMIIFRGLNHPTGITSAKPTTGVFTCVYFEESSELKTKEDLAKVDGTIRGELPNGINLSLTFAFNPWDIGHFIYKEFFENRLIGDVKELEEKRYMFYEDENFNLGFGKGLALHISSYKCNNHRSNDYDINMLELRKKAFERYKVEGLGIFGVSTEAVYPEFTEALIIPRQDANKALYSSYAIGIDTGLSNGEGKILRGEDVKIRSATTMQLVALSQDHNTIVCLNEFYHSNEQVQIKKTEPQLMEDIINKIIEWKEIYSTNLTLMRGIIPVYVDCADVGFRQGLEIKAKEKGLFNVRFMPSTKMKIFTRVDFEGLLQAMGEIRYSECCKNLIREIKNARRGAKGECREDINNHCLDAHEYAEYPLLARLRRWASYKEH